MPKRPTVDTVSTGFTSQTTINNNFTNVRDQFDNTLSLDGSTPNAMQADLDMDSNDILNARTLRADNVFINGVAVTSGEAAAAPVATDVVITDAGGFYTGSNVETALAELGALNAVTASATEINYLTGTTSAVQTQLDAKAPLASPALTGTPTAPTAAAGTNTIQLATTGFVMSELSGSLQLLQEIDFDDPGQPSLTTVDFAINDSRFDSFRIELAGVTMSSRTEFRLSTDGVSFDQGATDYTYYSRTIGPDLTTDTVNVTDTANFEHDGIVVPIGAGDKAYGYIDILNAKRVGETCLTWSITTTGSGRRVFRREGAGKRVTDAVHTHIRMFDDLGGIPASFGDTGRLIVWGRLT